jgi:hypothetical protein
VVDIVDREEELEVVFVDAPAIFSVTICQDAQHRRIVLLIERQYPVVAQVSRRNGRLLRVQLGVGGPLSGGYSGLHAEVCRQIEDHGLKMKEADAAIIVATLIESAARPHTHVEAPPEDRAENEARDEPATVIFSADNDARWVKKGRKCTLCYKGFARCDEEGFVD